MLSMTVLLRTRLPKMWLTGCVCGAAQSFGAGNWSRDLLLKFFSMLGIFFTKKIVFVKFVDVSFSQ